MRYSIFGAAILAAQTVFAGPIVRRQGVEEDIAPEGEAPEGCEAAIDGTFYLSPHFVEEEEEGGEAKRKFKKREEAEVLECELAEGILKDVKGKKGYIADNYQ